MSLRTVRRWITAGIVPSVKLGGARLVAQAELERLFSPAPTVSGGTYDVAKQLQKLGRLVWNRLTYLVSSRMS
jgi:hypothetical protein